MDLRRSVLTKQQNVLRESLNYSAYESAVEDSETSMYFSFNETLNASSFEKDDNEIQNNSMSSEADKENTVILRDQSQQSLERTPIADKSCSQIDQSTPIVGNNTQILPQRVEDNETEPEVFEGKTSIGIAVNPKDLENDSALQEAPEQEAKMDENEHQLIENIVSACLDDQLGDKAEAPSVFANTEAQQAACNIEIIVHDPNENVINPFTAPVGDVPDSLFVIQKPKTSAGTKRVNSSIPVEKRVPRRSVAIGKMPSHRVYSPVLRKSLDRKSKVASKLATSRRTIYEVAKPGHPRRSLPKSPKQSKAAVKPKIHKCSAVDCAAEFTTLRALQDHMKSHKPASSSQLSFECEYCDKKFQIQAAFFTHQSENCKKIPFNEKRKLISKRDKNESDRRRTAVFLAPAPKTPAVKKQANESAKKSGIKITPKKSLKCHCCTLVFDNAVSLAQHIVSMRKRDKGIAVAE